MISPIQHDHGIVTLDADYLRSLQRRFPGTRRFCGFGAATPDLSAPGTAVAPP